MRYKKILGVFTIIIGLGLSTSPFIYANDAQDINERLSRNKEEQESLDLQIDELNLRIEEVTNKVLEITERIEQLDSEMLISKNEIAAVKQSIKSNEDTLALRLKVINSNYNKNMLEVLLSSNTISDFFDRLYIIKSIVAQDKDTLKTLKDNKELCEKKERELETKKTEQESLKNELFEESKQIDENKLKLENLKKDLEFEEANLEAELELLIVELSSASYDLNLNGYVLTSGGWPIPGHTRISSPYGYRIHPILNVQKMHTGIDIPAPKGTPVVSIDDGIVIFSDVKGTYGNTIMIQHFDGKVSLYAHNSELVALVGQKVTKGEVVAKVGSTGRSTGNHSHFEIRINGQHVDPIPFLQYS